MKTIVKNSLTAFLFVICGVISLAPNLALAADLSYLTTLVGTDCPIDSYLGILSKSKRESSAQERLNAIRNIKECITFGKINKATEIARNSTSRDAFVTSFAPYHEVDSLLESMGNTATQENNFLGVSFGVAFGFSAGQERVTLADIAADGTIRATKQVKHSPRVVLEAHYYGWCNSGDCKAAISGYGPFFAVVADNNSISSFGLGFMYGWRDNTTGSNSSGFSFGLGAVLDENVTQLADGFVVGQKPPAGETTPKYTTKSAWSPLLIFSRTF